MTDISTTAIEIVPTPLEDVVSQDNFQDVQEIGSFLNETNNNSYLDKFCKSFKTLKKIFDFFRTLTLYWLKYGLWIKYFLAFVVFILLPLGVYSLCKIILFLFKSNVNVKEGTNELFQMLENLKNIKIRGSIFQITYFLGCDYKMIRILYGQQSSNAIKG
jgi:hypothetical protein